MKEIILSERPLIRTYNGDDLDIIELDTEYFEKAVKRVQRHISQQSLFKIAEKDTETLF